MKKDYSKWIWIVVLAIIAIGSVMYSFKASLVETYPVSIASLDGKRSDILGLLAASAATSTAITVLPGDAATPIAEKLMDLSTYFMIVLAAIYLEKYLLTITGYFVFTWIIPVCCIVLIGGILSNRDAFKNVAIKVAIFALAIHLVVPCSVMISNMIEETYNDSVKITITENETTGEPEIKEEESDVGFFESIQNKFEDLTDKVENGVTKVSDDLQQSLNGFIEALAVMIVTSCLIPILVIFVFGWITKLIFDLDFHVNIPKIEVGRKKVEE